MAEKMLCEWCRQPGARPYIFVGNEGPGVGKVFCDRCLAVVVARCRKEEADFKAAKAAMGTVPAPLRPA